MVQTCKENKRGKITKAGTAIDITMKKAGGKTQDEMNRKMSGKQLRGEKRGWTKWRNKLFMENKSWKDITGKASVTDRL